MTRSRNSNTEPPPEWCMYPSLHHRIAAHLRENDISISFYERDDESGTLETYDTNIMGYFPCRTRSCKAQGWFSGHVAITLRRYADNRYNARVYFQRCQKCKSLSRVQLDEDSYVDRVVYRLRRWNNVRVDPPPFSDEDRPPHLSHLCAGCQNGHCQARY